MSVDLTKQVNDNVYTPDVGIKQTFFSTDNRLNRKRYIKRILVMSLLYIVYIVLSETKNDLLLVVALVTLLVNAFSSIMLGIRRLHDCNKSGYWYLLSFVPILNIFLFLYILFQPGTVGDNKYGPDPLMRR